jgi:DNA polymerase-3 subunit alpha
MERCQELEVPRVGITDHGTVAGHLEFAKEAAKHDIQPIFGCELYHGVKTAFGKNERDQSHFVAGALSDDGLRNLWRLVDAASTNFRFVGRVNWEMLEKFGSGLFATSACIQGLVSKAILNEEDTDSLDRYLDIFGENFFIELHTYPGEDQEIVNTALVDLARERGIPLIYATDAHFAKPEQYEIHDAYVAMQTGESVLLNPAKRKMWHPKCLYIQDADEVAANLSYLPEDAVYEALTNSADLADRANATLPAVGRHLPKFIPKECPWVDQDLSAATLFIEKIESGLNDRYGPDVPDRVWNRARTEMEVFLDAGLEHYFLQAWDFVQFCESKGIKRGPGRGSAGGAIVAYALGITDVDPLEYGLIFERFYNPGREKGFPDIDNDFPTRDRNRVKKYMEGRWGHDKVRSIGTTTRLKPKAAIDKTFKAFNLDFRTKEELKDIIDTVPDLDILGSDSIGWDEKVDPGKTIYVMDHVGPEIKKWFDGISDLQKQKRVGRWLDMLRVVCSRISGYGIHPSGVVVSDVPLAAELPCMWNNSQKTQVTCFSMDSVDERMFVKQDFLGLANLDILDEWEKLIAPMVGEIDWKAVEKDYDPRLWELCDRGLTLGIFQINDGYARHLCKEIKPRSIEDLGIIVALNRPGPIRSGAPDSFIVRRRGEEDDKFDGRKIPLLAEILEPTYGWFLYQEQVIAFFEAIGLNKSEADAVRKILGKKKPEDMRALRDGSGEWEGKGYFELAEKAGLSKKLAETIWEKLEDFAKYSFNKSHAIEYATLGFRTLYAKYNAVAQFFIACIRIWTAQKKDKEEIGKYVSEARRMGIRVLPPDIHRSHEDIDTVDGDILFGFANVKGIGKEAARYLMKLREHYDLSSPDDFRNALETEQEKWESVRDLAKKGEIDFGEGLKGLVVAPSATKKSPRQQFPANRVDALESAGGWGQDGSMREIQKAEKEFLGVILTDECDEIFERCWKDIEQCDSYLDLEDAEKGNRIFLPGAVASLEPKKTRKEGKAMGIVTIEYEGDQAEFVVFPREWRQYRFAWKERTPAIFVLSKGDRGTKFEDLELLK